MSMPNPSYRITVVGAGNLAWSLIPALQSAGHRVDQLISRNAKRLSEYGQAFHISSLSDSLSDLLPSTGICLLCVPDQAIEACVEQLTTLAFRPQTYHVSGTTPLSSLAPLGEHIGVFYPLQTFSRSKPISFAQIPLCLEGTPLSQAILSTLGNSLSQHVHWMNSANRLKLHLGAVMVSNFPNVLFRLAGEQLQEAGIDFSIYQALVEEMVQKAFEIGPERAQTGPALRKDVSTLQQHLTLLEDTPDLQSLYWALSRLIQPELPISPLE